MFFTNKETEAWKDQTLLEIMKQNQGSNQVFELGFLPGPRGLEGVLKRGKHRSRTSSIPGHVGTAFPTGVDFPSITHTALFTALTILNDFQVWLSLSWRLLRRA